MVSNFPDRWTLKFTFLLLKALAKLTLPKKIVRVVHNCIKSKLIDKTNESFLQKNVRIKINIFGNNSHACFQRPHSGPKKCWHVISVIVQDYNYKIDYKRFILNLKIVAVVSKWLQLILYVPKKNPSYMKNIADHNLLV